MEQENNQNDTIKSIYIKIPMHIHKELKKRALDKDVTLSKYVMDSVMARVRAEKMHE